MEFAIAFDKIINHLIFDASYRRGSCENKTDLVDLFYLKTLFGLRATELCKKFNKEIEFYVKNKTNEDLIDEVEDIYDRTIHEIYLTLKELIPATNTLDYRSDDIIDEILGEMFVSTI